MNRMQHTTVCLVFHDSCGCDPTPRVHLGVEHPGWRSIALVGEQVKRETRAEPADGLPALPRLPGLQPLRVGGFRGVVPGLPSMEHGKVPTRNESV